MAKRDQDVHFLASKEEVERIHQKMDELGIRSMGAYLRKMALDGYCINLDLQVYTACPICETSKKLFLLLDLDPICRSVQKIQK